MYIRRATKGAAEREYEMDKLYKIVYRWNTLQGPAGTIFASGLTRERALKILRDHGDLYGRNLILVEE